MGGEQLPEGKDAVMTCAQLQMERNRARQVRATAWLTLPLVYLVTGSRFVGGVLN